MRQLCRDDSEFNEEFTINSIPLGEVLFFELMALFNLSAPSVASKFGG